MCVVSHVAAGNHLSNSFKKIGELALFPLYFLGCCFSRCFATVYQLHSRSTYSDNQIVLNFMGLFYNYYICENNFNFLIYQLLLFICLIENYILLEKSEKKYILHESLKGDYSLLSFTSFCKILKVFIHVRSFFGYPQNPTCTLY